MVRSFSLLATSLWCSSLSDSVLRCFGLSSERSVAVVARLLALLMRAETLAMLCFQHRLCVLAFKSVIVCSSSLRVSGRPGTAIRTRARAPRSPMNTTSNARTSVRILSLIDPPLCVSLILGLVAGSKLSGALLLCGLSACACDAGSQLKVLINAYYGRFADILAP